MPIKLVLTFLAFASVLWSASFLRAAIATFRKGVPFYVTGHRQGAMEVGASFGRIGAALITGVVLMITYWAVHAAYAAWTDPSSYFD